MPTIQNSILLWYLGISNIERVFSPRPEVLKTVLHTREYIFIKSPLVTNDIGKIPGKKGLPSVEGTGLRYKRGRCCWLFYMRILRDCCLGFGLREWKSPGEWRR